MFFIFLPRFFNFLFKSLIFCCIIVVILLLWLFYNETTKVSVVSPSHSNSFIDLQMFSSCVTTLNQMQILNFLSKF
jgi:hypothetical protein